MDVRLRKNSNHAIRAYFFWTSYQNKMLKSKSKMQRKRRICLKHQYQLGWNKMIWLSCKSRLQRCKKRYNYRKRRIEIKKIAPCCPMKVTVVHLKIIERQRVACCKRTPEISCLPSAKSAHASPLNLPYRMNVSWKAHLSSRIIGEGWNRRRCRQRKVICQPLLKIQQLQQDSETQKEVV